MPKNWPGVESAWANPGICGENLRIHEFLTFHLVRLASLAKGSVAREYLEPAGLSVPEWRLLATVVIFSPIPFADITSMTTMDKGQVSRTLRSAQLKGYVETEIVPADRRTQEAGSAMSRVIVRATQAGRDLYESVMPVAQHYQLGLIELMSPEERTVLLGILRRLYHYLQADGRKA